MKSSVAVAAGTAALALAGGAVAAHPKVGPPPPKLFGVVGPTTQLTLKDSKGRSVVRLKPGWYTIQVKDSTAARSFRLVGPGVSKATGARFLGAAIWGVRLRKGTYRYTSVGKTTPHRSFSVS